MTTAEKSYLVDFLKKNFPGELAEDESNLWMLILQKLTDYRIMSENVYDSVRLTEIFNRNTFLIGQWNHLEAVVNANSVMLQKKPHDITIMTKIAKVTHDLEIIRAAASLVNQQIMDLLEKESGKEFRYLPTTKNANKNA